MLARVDGRHLGLAALAILGCLYSLYFAALVLTFVGWLILDTAVTGQPEEAGRARRVLAWSPALLLGLGLAYLPWLSTVLAIRQQHIQRAANHWTWENVAERWQALTVGNGTSGSGWGSALALLLVLLGSIRAVRTAVGRAVLVAALCGTVGVDLLLLYADHWSSDRYNLVGWLFLAVLAGMGAGLLVRLRGGRAVTAAALLFLAFAQALGIVRDYHCRQDWRRVAEAVDELWRPGEPVLALNQSTRIPLLYYLRELRSPAAAAVSSVDGSHRRLAQLWPGDRCALLVLRNRGRSGRVIPLTQDADELVRYPASGARLRLLTPCFRERLFRLRGSEHSLGRATPQALTLHCERELPPELRVSRADRPCDPLLRLLGIRSWEFSKASRESAAGRQSRKMSPEAFMDPVTLEVLIERKHPDMAAFVVVPAPAVAAWSLSAATTVEGTLDGIPPGRRSLHRWDDDRWFVELRKETLGAAGKAPGERATLAISIASPELPAELQALIDSVPEARARWEAHTRAQQRMLRDGRTRHA